MGGVIPAALVLARVLTACVVLVGLAFMHSLGAAVGTGCPGGTPSMATSAAHAMAGGHDAVIADATMTMPGPALLEDMPHPVGHGAVCVSTPPRGDLTGRVVHAATAVVEPGALGQPSPRIQSASGALPRSGPALLNSLCVSRT